MTDPAFWIGMLRDWGIALAVAAAVFVGWNVLQPKAPSEGPAPDFALEDVAGEPVSLSALRGEMVVLNFWATWCGPCRAEIKDLAAFHEAHPDVHLLGISVDERLGTSSVATIGRRLGVNYRIVHDPTGVSADPYRVSSLPTTVVIDADGAIQAMHRGPLTKDHLEHLVFHPDH